MYGFGFLYDYDYISSAFTTPEFGAGVYSGSILVLMTGIGCRTTTGTSCFLGTGASVARGAGGV